MSRVTLTLIVVTVFVVAVLFLNIELPRIMGLEVVAWNKAAALTSDNVIIDIEYVEPSKPRQIVAMVHDTSYACDKRMWHKLDIASRLVNYDSVVVLFDLRFHGNSTPVLVSGSVVIPSVRVLRTIQKTYHPSSNGLR